MESKDILILANGEIRDEIIAAGIEMLRTGASADDVAEKVARDVEDDADEHSVGFSGLPNVLGVVELDASFMEGRNRRAGAVAGVRNFRNPIVLARAVMERTPHVLLVGAGAERFGDEIGAERKEMLTEAARNIWIERMHKIGLSDFDIQALQNPLAPQAALIDIVQRAFNMRDGSDTMNVFVRDASGHIVTAVTTSGVAWKYPGRAGDSPIIGAGNYADDRYGAAACMGLGEIAIRVGASARGVHNLRFGMSMDEAGADVCREMSSYLAKGQWVRMLMLDAKTGSVGGYATAEGLHYKVQRLNEDRPTKYEAMKIAA
ncbi:MAG: isoaspartyl peptidase/L-asparaginase [Chloroflexi bacterium]|nr:isoaspartyl peptidase/L-asparaginase [Chloroflexota bacterium]